MRTRCAASGLALLLALSSCAHPVIDARLPQKVRAAEVDPLRVVLICHGIVKDLGADWDTDLAAALTEQGILAIPVTYWADPIGVWLNYGWRPPGRELARLADQLEALRLEHAPDRGMILDGVGFSNGCESLLHAASQTEQVRFRRLVLLHSSSFCASFEADRLIRDGRAQSIVHYASPIDGTTLLAPFGAGQLGLWNRSDRVENRLRWMPHIAHWIGEGTRDRLLADLAVGRAHPAPKAGALSEAVADWLESERSRK